MLRFLHADALAAHPRLAETMFRDRAAQFRGRLGWPVAVDAQGRERDRYDDERPLYVLWQREDGTHGGSARFLPTTGRTMAAEHFGHLTDGATIRSPFIWECTRFCLAPGSDGRVAAALMLGGGELMRAFDLTHFLGVFDHHMLRVYRGIGAVPEVLGTGGDGRGRISIGLWAHDPASRARLSARSGVPVALAEHWCARDLGGAPSRIARSA